MKAPASPTTRLARALTTSVILVLGLAPRVDAQRAVTSTLSRYNVEKYFLDSLQTGAQRVIAPSGAISRITTSSAFLGGAFLPTRVAEEAVLRPTVPGGDLRVVLPDRAFAETGAGVGMLLVPVVVIEGGGLRYQNGSFRGSIRVGIEDSLQSGNPVGLGTPIRFFVSGDADSIMEPDVSVGHTNLPFTRVSLVEGTSRRSVSLNVRTDLHSDGVDVEVPLVFGELPIDATPPRVQGMGLETVQLVLGPALAGADVAVQLSADAGHLGDTEVRLSPDGTATTSLRSSWFGNATVRAVSVPFEDAEISVVFVFPWVFLAISLLGGAIGGFAVSLQKKGADARVRRVAQGALLGLIATVLYAVGVNVTPVNPAVTTGQALVFGLAALIGYLGTLRVPSENAKEVVAP